MINQIAPTKPYVKVKDRVFLRQYINNVIAGGSEATLAKKLGTSQQVINYKIHKLRKNVCFQEMLEAAGVSDDFLAGKIKKGCDAKKMIFTPEGEAKIVDDNMAQHRFIVTALEAKKHINMSEKNQPIAIQINYGHRDDKSNISPVRVRQEQSTESTE